MLFAELIPLCQRLQAIGRHITIETAGTLVSAGGVRPDVDQPEACELGAVRGRRTRIGSRRHERERHGPT